MLRTLSMTALLVLVTALVGCPGPPNKGGGGSIAADACTNERSCCCTGVSITDKCVNPPANSACPADHPILVNKP